MPPRWSKEEDRVLRDGYLSGVSVREIARALCRSPDAVSERRRALGLPARPRSRPWTAAEDELLRAASALGLPAGAVAERLSRSADQVRRRRRTLVGAGRAPVAFTAEEDAAIAACWTAGGDIASLARRLGRATASLRLRAQKLGVHRPDARPRWRPDEDAAVRDGYERGMTCAQIAVELEQRTPTAVAARAAKLGLGTYARAWTAREDAALERLARDGINLERAAQRLARTPEALRARARKLGIAPPVARPAGRRGQPWTTDDDALLALHRALNPATLAELLDRSPEAVTQRLRRLGLRDESSRSPHHPIPARRGPTPGERAAVLRELRTGGAARQLLLARRFGVAPAEIRAIAGRPPANPPGADSDREDAIRGRDDGYRGANGNGSAQRHGHYPA